MRPCGYETGPAALTAETLTRDYPGWGISHDGTWWMATCPAITLNASTPDELRAALERAISPGDDTP
jgi:hypothetical protein